MRMPRRPAASWAPAWPPGKSWQGPRLYKKPPLRAYCLQREVITMENKGVICDVSECRYNVDCCKCNLPQIKVTEHCASGSCGSQQVENPHFCQSYEKK